LVPVVALNGNLEYQMEHLACQDLIHAFLHLYRMVVAVVDEFL
jgi:hypothetical protein